MTDDTGFGFNTTSDKIKEVNPLHMCKVNLTSMEAKTQPTESQLNIYTDGSLTDKHAGSDQGIRYSARKKK